MPFLSRTLDNGLEVIAETNSEARSMSLGFFVRTGARDETDEVAGVSHFLEHMVFKGTARRTADDVNRQFDELGAQYNAFTSEEQTVYYASVLPEYLPPALDLLADILRPALRQEDFDTEKQVILEEIRMYEDQPPFGADDKARALHFGTHALGRSVLGTVESIAALSAEQMRSYFQRHYSPRNIVLAAAGQLDFDALTRLAEERCGAWADVPAARSVTPARGQGGFLALDRPQAVQQYVLQLADGPGGEDPDRYAAKLLATVLGDDCGSRLYWALVDPGHAETVSLGHHDYVGAGLFVTYMACAPELTRDNLQRIADLYRTAEAEGIRDDELARAKSKVNSRVVLGSERPRGRLFTLGANWLQRCEYRSVRDDLEAVDRLRAEDLQAVLRRYPLSRSTTVVVGPAQGLAPSA